MILRLAQNYVILNSQQYGAHEKVYSWRKIIEFSILNNVVLMRKLFNLLNGYCSTVQGLLDWCEVDLRFTELFFIQIHLCVMCVFVLYSPVSLSSCPFFGHPALPPLRGGSASRVSPQSCQSHESLWGLRYSRWLCSE